MHHWNVLHEDHRVRPFCKVQIFHRPHQGTQLRIRTRPRHATPSNSHISSELLSRHFHVRLSFMLLCMHISYPFSSLVIFWRLHIRTLCVCVCVYTRPWWFVIITISYAPLFVQFLPITSPSLCVYHLWISAFIVAVIWCVCEFLTKHLAFSRTISWLHLLSIISAGPCPKQH